MKSTSKDLWKALKEINMQFVGKNYINGEWENKEESTFAKQNPADLEELGSFPLTGDETVNRAYKEAL